MRSNRGWFIVRRFIEHALVELQPREFAIEKTVLIPMIYKIRFTRKIDNFRQTHARPLPSAAPYQAIANSG